MNTTLRTALERGLTCDITTIGRRSGKPSRIEIWYFVIEGQTYITGTPGPRDWYANILVNPHFTFHIKEGARADLPARAIPISDTAQRRHIMGEVMRRNNWFASGSNSLDAWVAGSPLIRVEFDS